MAVLCPYALVSIITVFSVNYCTIHCIALCLVLCRSLRLLCGLGFINGLQVFVCFGRLDGFALPCGLSDFCVGG